MSKQPSQTQTTIELPVGPTPAWETEEPLDDEDTRLSVAQSCVVHASLRQSRDKWLHSNFPVFSAKGKGNKPPERVPPPHTIQSRGRCTFEIGPHIFQETVVYEVHYLPAFPQVPTPQTASYRSPSIRTWQAVTQYGSASLPQPQSTSVSPSTSSTPRPPDDQSAPLLSSLNTVTTITPALISQVNAAASTNPILANLLQLAAAGNASPDQLKTLGLLIQSLAATDNTSPQTPASTQSHYRVSLPPAQPPPSNPSPPSIVNDFDIVIEFRDNPSERFIFPRGPVMCKKISASSDSTCEIIVLARFPFSAPSSAQSSDESTDSAPSTERPRVVNFTLKKASFAIWDSLSRWMGNPEKVSENRRLLCDLKTPPRVYLGHQLVQGSLLHQLQNSVLPNYNMKPLKPNLASAARLRRRQQKKQEKEAAANEDRATAVQHAPPKRRRTAEARGTATSLPIRCLSCNQTDVPLILGGRFCRPCVDSGQVPSTQPSSNSSAQAVKPATPLKPSVMTQQISDQHSEKLTVPP